MKAFFVLFFLALGLTSIAQVAINTDGSAPDTSAMLHVKSFNKGVLIPQMTQTQIGAIPSPANGLVVFCTSDSKFYAYISIDSTWKELLYGSGTIAQVSDCGNTLTINHVAGAIAPVTKTVTYGTVSNIPGEPTKCWITSNLGADHQATAVNDATEASAGWYWQFNRKQGYKHDGSTRTPGTVWITQICEGYEWQTENDPCSQELGSGWRIPTSTEWVNVDGTNGGNWSDWTGSWNSGLNLHAAGSIRYDNGLLYSRGSSGYYWSSRQNNVCQAFLHAISQTFSDYVIYNKSFGLTLRCIKDQSSQASCPTVTTDSITNITTTSASGGGTVTSGGVATVTARGLCWSTSPNPTTSDSHTNDGTGLGAFVSNITGLESNAFYYVRAYATNIHGTAYGNEVSITPPLVWSCGYAFTIEHESGAIAPVNKTVTYGTVSNIPGEPSKCWITSNLGADHQATAVDDSTEASAGWYWQFNYGSGFKHDGTTRTPNSTWITSISSGDWANSSDPCFNALGNGWRIPTKTEWMNVRGSAGGNWTNWNGAWNSGLKLHAAGYLNNTSGELMNRGILGNFWSSTSNSPPDFVNGYYLGIGNSNTFTGFITKSFGMTLRCLIDTTSTQALVPAVSTASVTNINITSATATGGGEVTSDGGSEVTARGICWGTSSNPTLSDSHTSDGTGTGSFVSSMTGLSSNTTYYVRAYAINRYGTTYGNEVNFTTTSIWSCGYAFTIEHDSGAVAPVNKTVSYGTVSNIPGEPSKCWITSNLGADHQATAVDDSTETSAGWYWQFNRKQGYKHDGTYRTPNTTWITEINENLDWEIANDPCALELGNGWRIPTNSEWTIIDGSTGGNWTDWNGPWNSGLRLHAAGFLNYSDGKSSFRGIVGQFWSSVSYNTNAGYYLTISSTSSLINISNKSFGRSVRCLIDTTSQGWVPSVTTAAVTNFNVSTNSALGGGEVTSGGGSPVTARGVCWSTSPNPFIIDNHTTDGSGIGAFVSNITGLIPGAQYYLRAYATNAGGTGYGNSVNFVMPLNWSCNDPFTISHVSGNVAPVTKTVTYGTVSNIPGEPTKCWITSNLGADHQATAVNDATEASAGWYWQFNRMQGYKHDGTNRTPNTTWITSINENLDWLIANDPCNLELGSGWRIPTNTEWMNVSESGNWANNNGPWLSNLKLHSAGGLVSGNGYLFDRGIIGYFWNRIQANIVQAQFLVTNATGYSLIIQSKTYGYSLRCLKDTLSQASVPTITTAAITNINLTSLTATGGGEVTSDGGYAVTARGICWSTTSSPTTTDNHTNDGSGTGVFVSNITGLSANTIYYVRAYSKNSYGTGYGNEVTFSTTPVLATLSTDSITIITGYSARCHATVLSDGGVPETQRGICWNTASTPTVFNDSVMVGIGTGSYTGNLTNLSPNTTYYCRAFAVNDAGTSYGNELLFNTSIVLPTLSTSTISGITGNSAVSGGNISYSGGGVIAARGVSWSTSHDPTLADNHTDNGSGIGSFTSSITGLNPNTIYNVRAYATNETGTAYGNEQSFTTLLYLAGSPVSDFDGNQYPTVILGNQVWMSKNLITTHYANGDLIPELPNTTQWSAATSGAWCWYNNSNTYDTVYGKLYNWYAVNDPRNVCPTGWHVPSDAEWDTLTNYLGPNSEGGKMKETGFIHWTTPNTGATNESNYTGLPGGLRGATGSFGVLGSNGCWWSSSGTTTNAWYRNLLNTDSEVHRSDSKKGFGYSIRCIMQL